MLFSLLASGSKCFLLKLKARTLRGMISGL
nr:MAG TPA: hypothetical protein [Caudoviricetes sp.]DAY63384.1 MAG TPA: hypothetical protein [Caudoviricetes sp.]